MSATRSRFTPTVPAPPPRPPAESQTRLVVDRPMRPEEIEAAGWRLVRPGVWEHRAGWMLVRGVLSDARGSLVASDASLRTATALVARELGR